MERYYTYIKRNNRIGQFFLGDKCVEGMRRKEYKDSRAYDKAVAEIRDIEKEIEQKRITDKAEIDKIRTSIEATEFKQIEREIAWAEMEARDLFDDLIRRRETQREEKRAMERVIITVKKNEFLTELKKNLEEMEKTIKSFLEKSQKNFISILSTGLDRKYEAITREKSNIEKMVRINGLSKEEVEISKMELQKEKVNLIECMKKIEQEKEAI